MFQKIISFFMAIVSFFMSLFGIGTVGKNSYIYKDLRYGAAERNTLDLYVPKDAKGSCGLVLNIHGGAWIVGDKSAYDDDTLSYISDDLGFAAASINYRYISDDVDVLDILEDIDAALRTIKDKALETGAVIDRVALTGVSAGAHLALLYGYKYALTAPMKISFIASYCGPTDLSDTNFYSSCPDLGSQEDICNLMSKACGKKFNMDTYASAIPNLKAASPITYVSSVCPPTIIAHGKKDTIVPFSNAVKLDAALGAVGVKHDFVIYENSNHGLESDSDSAKAVDKLLEQYIKDYLK